MIRFHRATGTGATWFACVCALTLALAGCSSSDTGGDKAHAADNAQSSVQLTYDGETHNYGDALIMMPSSMSSRSDYGLSVGVMAAGAGDVSIEDLIPATDGKLAGQTFELVPGDTTAGQAQVALNALNLKGADLPNDLISTSGSVTIDDIDFADGNPFEKGDDFRGPVKINAVQFHFKATFEKETSKKTTRKYKLTGDVHYVAD